MLIPPLKPKFRYKPKTYHVMKKMRFYLLFLFLPLCGIITAQTASISGTVTETGTSHPVSNQAVIVNVLDSSISAFNQTDTFFTNQFGVYQGTINYVSVYTSSIIIKTLDCDGSYIYENTHPIPVITKNFVICDSSSNCQAAFYNLPGSMPGTNTIKFVDQSIGNPVSWNWDFGDGNSSTQQNPTHSYANSGSFNVSLSITTSNGCNSSVSDLVFVNTTPPCQAMFNYTISANNPYTVAFTDASTGNPVSWNWNFGDSTTSTQQHPVHTYSSLGNYNPSLTITTFNGCTSTYNYSLKLLQQTGNIVGTVTLEGGNYTPTHATAYLIDNIQGNWLYSDTTNVIDSLSISNYSFQDIPYNTYYVKAQLNQSDPQYGNYVPTYYGDVIIWNQALAINVCASAFNHLINNIALKKVNAVSGPGSISGNISYLPIKGYFDNVNMLLFDENDKLVGYDIPNNVGDYSFANLPYGKYKVHPDITGYTTIPSIVKIDAMSEDAVDIDFTIGIHQIMSINSNHNLISSIYPNPASSILSVILFEEADNPFTIRIINTNGQEIKKQLQPTGNRTIKVDVSGLADGMYYLQIIGDKGICGKPFMKVSP